jgi:hypothetical protein
MCKMKMQLNVKWGVMGKGPEKLSEKWLLITSLSGCSLEQKLQSVQEFRRAQSQPWRVPSQARLAFCDGPSPAPPTVGDWPAESAGPDLVDAYKSYAELRHSRGGCQARPGRPSVTNLSSVTDRRSEFIYKICQDKFEWLQEKNLGQRIWDERKWDETHSSL